MVEHNAMPMSGVDGIFVSKGSDIPADPARVRVMRISSVFATILSHWQANAKRRKTMHRGNGRHMGSCDLSKQYHFAVTGHDTKE